MTWPKIFGSSVFDHRDVDVGRPLERLDAGTSMLAKLARKAGEEGKCSMHEKSGIHNCLELDKIYEIKLSEVAD